MSDIVTTFKSVAEDQDLGFLHAMKSIQALTNRKNAVWPILYLDNPKTRRPDMNRQGALANTWEVFITILNKDKKQASTAQTQAIIDQTRAKMNDFLQALRDEVDDHDRKVVQEITGLQETELRQWSTGVLSGVATPITLTFVDPTFNCTT